MLIGSTEFFFTWQSLFYLPLGVCIGTGICLVSGVYPAWMAANLDPVEALRAE
jgi:putative ABC transport system permease protein